MKKEYTGVWSNGKKTIDLDNLNSKYEMYSINHNDGDCVVYARESGTIVEKWAEKVVDDYFCDIGEISHQVIHYKVLGKNFKKIKDQGVLDEEYKKFMEAIMGNGSIRKKIKRN